MKKEPAFPFFYTPDADLVAQTKSAGSAIPKPINYSGLTKLEYFAGLAMQGMFASSDALERAGLLPCAGTAEEFPGVIARGSVEIAKALIAELEKEE